MVIAQDLSEEMPSEIERKDTKLYKRMTSLAEQWLNKIGEEKLTGGVLFSTEFWRYMHNREPFNPMGIILGAILKRWRHLDLLVIGNAPKRHELDRYSCLPYVTSEVKSSWLGHNKAGYRIFPTTYVGERGVLRLSGKPIPIKIDGGKPRDFLDGKRYFDLFVSKSKALPQGGINRL